MKDPYQEAFDEVLAREKARRLVWVVALCDDKKTWSNMNWRARPVTLVHALEDGRVVIEHKNGVRIAKRKHEVFFTEKEALKVAKARFVP